ncbi:endolytic transglycosylase MltG [Candidatus Peregrinibacteria bacterium]|nr:endolytic transglycosylase MltG [Candidatus Peregrinibacteria bacterium]
MRKRPLYKTRRKSGFGKILLILILLIGGYMWFRYSSYQTALATPVNSENTEEISFLIKKGDSFATITSNLLEKELIADEEAFKMYTKFGGYDRQLEAGRFMLSQSQTIPEIVEELIDGEKSQVILTVLEGYTVQDIDDELVEMNLIQPGDFITAVDEFDNYDSYFFLNEDLQKDLIHPLEGYLFPDTYFLDPVEFNNENLIQLMLDNFENRIGDDLKNADRPIHDIAIMASILEKEVRTDADIPVVAGILWKRLDNNWLVGADATMLYLKDDRTIDYFDLQEDTPYNTRLNAGLPPGPIGNAGLKSFMGALHPEESPYWFYLTTLDTGEVIYGENNAQHEANKAQYL